MTGAQFLPFLAAILLLYLIPGPAMILLTQTTMRHGPRAALLTIAALNAGEALLVFSAAAGLALTLSVAKPLFGLIAWSGLAYLLCRAARAWHDVMMPPSEEAAARQRRRSHVALPGFAVAFSNPATLFFYTALLPQFVVPGANESGQLFQLAALYVVTVIVLDLALVLAVSRFAGRRAFRLAPRAGLLCNALALTAITAFVTTHVANALPLSADRVPRSIAAQR
jgi:threonine/homoserine/homoserine lactone efflux protein